MATDGVTPNFSALGLQNSNLSSIAREHASTHFLCELPNFLHDDIHSHEQILILDASGQYSPHHVLRMPLGLENQGYLLLPVDKSNRHIKTAFRLTDHFENHGDIIDSYNRCESDVIQFVLQAIKAHYGEDANDLELSIHGHSRKTSSNQCFTRSFVKHAANSNLFDSIRHLHVNHIDSLEEQEVQEAVCTKSLQPISDKPLTVKVCQFGKIAKGILQKEAYAHIFEKKPATLQQIEAANAKLPPKILEYASAHLLSSYSYSLAEQGFLYDREILLLKEDGTYKLHQVYQLPLVLGMFGYVMVPNDRSDKNIRVTFRGTDFSDPDSAFINLEQEGPSSTSFEEVKERVMDCIRDVIQRHFGGTANDIKVTVSGHSQGASTSQHFATALLERRASSADFDSLTKLTLSTFNDPGVTQFIRQKANNLVLELTKLSKPLEIKANFGPVDGDIVQIFGEDMIFVDLPYPIVETTMLKVDKELAYRKYKTDEIKHALGNAHYLNTFFSWSDPDGSVKPSKIHFDHNHMLYTNKTAEDHNILRKEMLYKIANTMRLKRKLHTLLNYTPLNHTKTCIDSLPLLAEDYLHLGVAPLNYLRQFSDHAQEFAKNSTGWFEQLAGTAASHTGATLHNIGCAGYGLYIGYQVYNILADAYGGCTFSFNPRALLSQYSQQIMNWYSGKKPAPSYDVNQQGILQEVELSNKVLNHFKIR